MGELLLHIIFGLLIYPVCYVVFRFSFIIGTGLSLLNNRLLSALYIPEIIVYTPRILLPMAWIGAGFTFGPHPDIDGDNKDPNSALAFFYLMAWIFGVAILLFKVFSDVGKKDRETINRIDVQG